MEHILIVDNEPAILELCKRILEDKYKISTAQNAKDALDILSDTSCDLVVSDLKMPGMDGVELLQKIKSMYPHTEVMIFTGQGTIETAVETMKKGAYDYILKPFNITDLSTSVNKCIEYSKLKKQENIFRETIYLYQLSQELSSNQSEKELLDFVLKQASKALNSDSGSIFMFEQENNVLAPIVSYGKNDNLCDKIKVGEKVAGWVAKTKEAIVIQDGFKNTPQFKDYPMREEIASSMVAPLVYKDIFLGIISINRSIERTKSLFSENDLEHFKLFCLHASLILIALRNKQAIQELSELKSNFVANVTHELKTPLMAIGGAAELLASLISEEKTKQFLELIERNTNRMKTLVNDLLDFSRMETKKLRLTYTEFDFKELALETINNFELSSKSRNINLSAESPGVAVISADYEKIKQVLSNFIQNALKFTPEGGFVRLEYRINDGKNLVFSVTDSGIGIEKSQQDKIFEKFYQVDNGASRDYGGFGLGLAIVKYIINEHKGSVRVESEPGKGSKFTASIPVSV
ncbi:MAG: response regulator [Elusimicrobiota bacterium]